jgi:hypothetical protein
MVLGGAFAAAATVALALAADTFPGAGKQAGTFALHHGHQDTVAAFWATPADALTQTLKVQQFHSDTMRPVVEYGLSMGATGHFFIIRDDFATFKHYVADYNVTASALQHSFTREPNHGYYLYTDTHPFHMTRQVYRFNVGTPAAPNTASMSASSTNSTAGPYTVIFSKTTIPANQPYLELVTIDSGGSGAQDLSPYFGGAAHMVMINTSNLEYVFTHPTLRGQKLDKSESFTMEQEFARLAENSQVGPNQQVEIPALAAGTYKVWYEFTGGASEHKYDAPFTIVVQ